MRKQLGGTPEKSHSNEIKYKICFIYPNTPKALPIVNFARNGNVASFYLTHLDQQVWDKTKKAAYSDQVHPCPWMKITLKYRVLKFNAATQSWDDVKLEDFGIVTD